ncbi:MAG: hypothetical protein HYS87_00500 [Candidatus Colwellbacteria bacterium]|nr:hypothetical protein [Candidatus Colwellbacteria bacterium]
MGHQEDARLALEVVEKMVHEFEESLKEGTPLYNTIAKEEEPTNVKNYIVGRVLALESAINRELDMLWKLMYGTENPKKVNVATIANKKRMELRQAAMARQNAPQLVEVPVKALTKAH